MELDRRLLVAHCAAHTLSILAGLMVVVPLALNGSAFKGRCALFTTGSWRTDNRTDIYVEQGEISHLVIQQWGPPSACQFATFVGVFTVLYGAAQGWRSIFYLHGRLDDTLFSAFLTLILSLCVLFLSGGASVTLSLGLASWCNTVTDDNTRPYSCAESQSVPMYLDVETSSFYTELTLAEVALWSVTALWLTHSILSFMRLYHSHSEHISGPCLPREKEHLLGHSSSSSGSSGSDRGSPSPAQPLSTAPSIIFV
ncbi:transmembrane protein 179-like [Oncorhynchus keta]|uniref:transmembrane protein 179-like n=1 Tax=Oncorhynchus keta TaxID=8018 RepID=UPI0015F97C56|nr:transmembrane protein 179-like [Oncorhynchus keta]